MDTDVGVAMSSGCWAVTPGRLEIIPWRVLSAMVVLSMEATDTPVKKIMFDVLFVGLYWK